MTRRLALVGKIGPAFGDRASFVALESSDSWITISNWPRDDREDALRVAFDNIRSTDLDTD